MKAAIFASLLAHLLMLSTATQAATWVEIGTTPTGAVWHVDSESVRADGSDWIVWIRKDASADRTVSYRTSKARYRINCESWTMQRLDLIEYDARGVVTYSSRNSYRDMRAIVPETAGEAVARHVCDQQEWEYFPAPQG